MTQHSSRLSILAVFETVIAVVIGVILAAHSQYWMIWTSVFLTPLVHLRSKESMAIGRKWLDSYWEGSAETSWLAVCTATALSTALLSYFLWHSTGWLMGSEIEYHHKISVILYSFTPVAIALFSCCFIIAPAKIVGKLSSFLSVANTLLYFIFLMVTGAPYAAMWIPVSVAFFVSIMLILSNFGPQRTRSLFTRISIFLIIPFLILGILLRLLVIRIGATAITLQYGKSNFVSNWKDLVLRTDVVTEPELMPGLPQDHRLRIHAWSKRIRRGNPIAVRIIGSIISLLYLPSIIYRIVLKSSLPFYLPLLWVSSPPGKLLDHDKKQLKWDDSFAKTPIELVAFATSAIGSGLFVYRAWDYSEYIKAITWAEENGWPSLYPMLGAGLIVDQIQGWQWLTGANALLTTMIFLWAWQISWQSKKRHAKPTQLAIWSISKLNTFKNFLSFAVLIVGLTGLIMFLYSECSLPAAMSSILSKITGAECIVESPSIS